jgi:hypothetical protein
MTNPNYLSEKALLVEIRDLLQQLVNAATDAPSGDTAEGAHGQDAPQGAPPESRAPTYSSDLSIDSHFMRGDTE